jgi:ankyrin repeat protein
MAGSETEEHDKQRQFLWAVYEDMAKAEELLRQDPQFLHYRSIAGETVFHYLIVESDLDRASKLLEWGSDINTQDYFGATPLAHAVMLDYLDVVKWLVQHGAQLEPKNVNGETALAWATKNEKAAIFQFLISLPRKHPIDSYYSDLDAQDVFDDKELVMRSYLIGLGLTKRYGDDFESF